MEPKKNPKADLKRYSGLYFSIGLAVVLGLVYIGINWKSYEKKFDLSQVLAANDELEEEIPITQEIRKPPPPPPPPPPPEVIEVVEDDDEQEETKVATTESNKDETIEVKKIEVKEEDVDIDVPFAVIEQVPIFPGCESVPKAQQRDCFQDKLNNHVRKTFRYPDVSQEMGVQGRVFVSFKINKDGTISVVGFRGPDKNLEQEAVRIIEKLPKMIPGKQRGNPVAVTYSYPIVFKLQ